MGSETGSRLERKVGRTMKLRMLDGVEHTISQEKLLRVGIYYQIHPFLWWAGIWFAAGGTCGYCPWFVRVGNELHEILR